MNRKYILYHIEYSYLRVMAKGDNLEPGVLRYNFTPVLEIPHTYSTVLMIIRKMASQKLILPSTEPFAT